MVTVCISGNNARCDILLQTFSYTVLVASFPCRPHLAFCLYHTASNRKQSEMNLHSYSWSLSPRKSYIPTWCTRVSQQLQLIKSSCKSGLFMPYHPPHCSLIPRSFPPPVFDRLQCAKTEGEGLGEIVTCMTSGRREGRYDGGRGSGSCTFYRATW